MRTTWWTWIGILALGLIGCGASRGTSTEAESERSGDPAEGERSGDPAETETTDVPIPEHLKHFGGLYVRVGDRIIDAPEADVAVARSYPTFARKGNLVGGMRLTILTASTTVEVGDEVRVIHVLEATAPGTEVFVMGPKRVHAEYLDGKLATTAYPGLGVYDGAVLTAPAADYNYDITTYTFTKPGTHTIQWRHGGMTCEIAQVNPVSNTLTITVVD